MANVQHIFSGTVDPNADPLIAPVGSHYSDTMNGLDYILSITGVWHPVLPLLRTDTKPSIHDAAPAGTLFITKWGAANPACGINVETGWAEIATIESIWNVTADTKPKCRLVIDAMNNRLVVNNEGALSYIDLTALV